MDTDHDRHEAADEEHPVFIPPEDLRAIERVIDNLDRAQRAFRKAAGEMNAPAGREPDERGDKT